MDTTEINHVSLCSGYGGIDLGLRRVLPNVRTVAYAEIEAFACENLLARMEGGQLDAAPIWSDLKSFPWAEFSGLVDILSGGYPCQPFSAAGKRAGADDPRHLWPYIAEGIRILKPALCLFENVEGHITLGLSSVVSDLEEMGYKVSWGIFSAAECGAPHQRKRVFIMAHRIDQGSQGWLRRWQDSGREGEHGHTGCGSAGVLGRWPNRPGQPQRAWEPPRVVGNAKSRARFGQTQGTAGHTAQPDEGLGNPSRELLNWSRTSSRETEGSQPANPSQRQAEPALGGDIDGTASGMDYAELCTACDNRTDELRLLGNGVVPATAAIAFRTLLKELTQ